MAYEGHFDTNTLLPQQPTAGVGKDVVAYYCKRIMNGETIPPVPLVSTTHGLVLADGHHRTVAHHQMGKLVPGFVHETDEDIRNSTYPVLDYFDTVKEFTDNYAENIRPIAEKLGRATMADYVQQHKESVAAADSSAKDDERS
jgi:hypothetical protein